MSPPRPAVGVVGASARAAVHSLARAGLGAWAVDLFGDRDLVAPNAVCPVEHYPAALPSLARAFPPGPVLYTGGLENHPDVVAELARTREVWGNPPAVLEAVRDPHRLAVALAAAGLGTPAVVPPGAPCPATGRWLRKPLRSSAGHGVRFARPGEVASEVHYFQEFIEGTPMSAVYFGATLLGATNQLVGNPWLHARPFGYAGNVGPTELGPELGGRVARLGEVLAVEFGLLGVWNFDFLAKDGRPYPVEVNPRYSASVEVVEHATGRGVWGGYSGPGAAGRHVGKAIYFAPRDLVFPAEGPWEADLAGAFDPWRLPAFADVPGAGATIPAGQPVLTILVSGSSPTGCRERLQSRAAELDRLLSGDQP